MKVQLPGVANQRVLCMWALYVPTKHTIMPLKSSKDKSKARGSGDQVLAVSPSEGKEAAHEVSLNQRVRGNEAHHRSRWTKKTTNTLVVVLWVPKAV